jgi:hypothetical protein
VTVESAKREKPESPGGIPWTFVTAAALVFAAVCIVSARVGVTGLPGFAEVGRPNLATAVVLALAVAVMSWLLAVFGLLRMRSARWLRFGFVFIAAAEAAAWLVALHYYRHWEHIYDGGNAG